MRVGEMLRQARRLRHLVHPIGRSPGDYSPLLQFIGDARFVLLGASTHGTAEFEAERTLITRLLIEERGFAAIATSLDLADGAAVTACAAGPGEGVLPAMPFPAWTLHNSEVVGFLHWLRDWNIRQSGSPPVAVHGLDEFCTRRSAERAVSALRREDPELGERLRGRLGQPGRAQRLPALGISHALEEDIVAALTAGLAQDLASMTPTAHAPDEAGASRHESILRHAPSYYRAFLAGSVAWRNLRARRLADSLTRVVEQLDEESRGRGVVVWLDSLEAGDARATDMGRSGELSLGQLVRERRARDTVSMGFTSYEGTLLAATEWGGDPEVTPLPPAQARSYEAILHDIEEPRVLMFTAEADAALPARRLERAIGPVLRPADEPGTYFEATIARQYDAVFHIERTTALTPVSDG